LLPPSLVPPPLEPPLLPPLDPPLPPPPLDPPLLPPPLEPPLLDPALPSGAPPSSRAALGLDEVHEDWLTTQAISAPNAATATPLHSMRARGMTAFPFPREHTVTAESRWLAPTSATRSAHSPPKFPLERRPRR